VGLDGEAGHRVGEVEAEREAGAVLGGPVALVAEPGAHRGLDAPLAGPLPPGPGQLDLDHRQPLPPGGGRGPSLADRGQPGHPVGADPEVQRQRPLAPLDLRDLRVHR
jgi:hypothetical protein